MRTIRFLLQKEFIQIFRNKSILAIILVMPVIQLVILPMAADYEVKQINIAIVDHDQSPYSHKLTNTLFASRYFNQVRPGTGYASATSAVDAGKADIILEIPAGFERDLVREGSNRLFIAADAINGVKAGVGSSYLRQILKGFNHDINLQWAASAMITEKEPGIAIETSNWYNPLLNYRLFMVPGILAILVTMIGGFLTALNIVKEKESGTIEQINVTPIRKHHFIAGKLLPFWLLGMVVVSIGLSIAWLVYDIVPEGNILVLLAFVAVYLLAILGFGLLVSTFCETQQQAMFIMFFFIMIFILMGGLFTAIDSMPAWARFLTKLNPVSYLISVMRLVIIKGSSFRDILPQLAAIGGFAVVLNTWAVINYKKTN